MYGTLTARTDLFDEAELARYRACYCGLCRAIRRRHGELAGLTLQYDMTFLCFLLSSLYETEETSGSGTCLPHPSKPRTWLSSAAIDYAADMNVALGYLKCRDNWQDDGSLVSAAGAAALKAAYGRIKQDYPRQCTAMERSIAALSAVEKQNLEAPDAASATFGELMAEVLVWREDRWSETLRAFGYRLGQFIYLMDAVLDLDEDTRRERYNPFRRRYRRADNESFFRSMLQMLLGEALRAYDRLPLVADSKILNNILCAGVWAQFDSHYQPKKEEA